ncbi:MAG: SusD/RagB family nutrient-binding outer membrane lipoprotein, partial [Bacteroidota bacterium]
MKKIISYSILFLLLTVVSSCDKGLGDLNINRTSPTSLDAALLLNNAIINLSFPTKTVIYDMGVVQQLISPNGGVLTGANFNLDSRDAGGIIWAAYYQNVIKYTVDAINKTKSVTTRSNLYNMARIIQAYAFMILTDEHGDIPYTEAGGGYLSQVFLPKYDAQQDIYPKLIQELTDAATALNASGTIETSDVLYAG